MDESGRLVLPLAAREKIGLAEEVVFEGHGDKFHIMNPADKPTEEASIEALMEEMGQGNAYFDPLSLAVARGPADSA